jgi:hypothetical protein
MPLLYSLIENPMTPDPNDRMAITQVNESFTLDDVIDQMISRGSTVTKAEALSVYEEFSLAIEQLIRNGNSISTPLFTIMPRVVGVFNSDDDSFDSSRHQVKLRINPGMRLREMATKIPVEKIVTERPQPVLVPFHDNAAGSQDETVTPGGGARITGALLKFDEADVQQGIFFVNVATAEVIRVSGELLRNKPGELIFVVPALLAGTYKIEVRAITNKGGKTIRTGALPYEVTVS